MREFLRRHAPRVKRIAMRLAFILAAAFVQSSRPGILMADNGGRNVPSNHDKAPAWTGRQLVVERRYLLFPVQRTATVRRVRVLAGQKPIDDFDIKLPAASEKADLWVFLDVHQHKGHSLRIESLLPAGSRALDAVKQSDDLPDAENLYREKHRPQFHFTARRGWLNDPNGLVWANGKYHLFFQHNPYGWEWGNMHWGHATSPDLFHWTELPTALTPREHGDGAFSGSAVVDTQNTSGWGKPGHPALVAAFTSVKRGECLVYSTDGGQTFTEFAKNPILVHAGRDPRLLWYAPTQRWILAVYDSQAGHDGIAFLSSPDFKTWTAEGRIDGFFECPDLFEMPVIGRPGESRWVIYSGDGEYRIGRFDGHTFRPETSRKERVWYGDFYAAQTFSNVPDHRRIQIGWGRNVAFPDMPFNQQMTVPVELTLRPAADGLRLFANPARELAGLRKKSQPTVERTVEPGHPFHQDLGSDLLEIELEAQVGSDAGLTLTVRGVPITFDGRKQQLICRDVTAPLAPAAGNVTLHVLVDRGSVEIFANDGRIALSKGILVDSQAGGYTISAEGAPVHIQRLDVHELSSVW
jgi:fructan beta-fructosidase